VISSGSINPMVIIFKRTTSFNLSFRPHRMELLAPGCAALMLLSVSLMFFIGLRGLALLGIGSFFSRKKNQAPPAMRRTNLNQSLYTSVDDF